MQRTVEPQDFLLAAMDGLRARIDDAQAMLEALQRTVNTPGYGFAGETTIPPAKRLGRPTKALVIEPRSVAELEPETPSHSERVKRSWTPAMRKAQAKRLRDRWAAGETFGGKTKKTQPEQRYDSLGRRIPPSRKGKKITGIALKNLQARAASARAALAAKRAAAKVPTVKVQKPKRKGSWTPEQRAKLSKAMKEAARRRGLNVRGEVATG